jgi:uncharacterized protein (TIGR00251 family)
MAEPTLRVRVTPRSSRNEILVEEAQVKAWVTASPTDGEANKAVIALLAKKLGVAPSRIQIVSGQTSRDKAFSIEQMSSQEALGRLSET